MNIVNLKNIFLITIFSMIISCGSSQDLIDRGGGTTPTSVNNVPDPNSFFNTQRLQEGFSPDLQRQIVANSRNAAAEVAGATRYDTSFGPIYELPPRPESTEEIPTAPTTTVTDTSCNARVGSGEKFLCITNPESGFEIANNSLNINGAVNMTDALLFSPSDPIVLISIFKKESGNIRNVSEAIVTGYDTTSTAGAVKEIGVFNKSLNLEGPGYYVVVLASFKYTDNLHTQISIEQQIIHGKRQGPPQLQLVKVKPDEYGNFANDLSLRNADIQNNSQVSAFAVQMTLNLSSPGSRGVGIFIRNTDQNSGGNLRYQSGVTMDNVTQTATADLKLFPGLNCFNARAVNTLLPDSPSSEIAQFCVTNKAPTVDIKVLDDSPIKDGAMIQVDESSVGFAQNLRFCLVNHGMLSTPVAANECIRSWPGEVPLLKFNGSTVPVSAADSSGIYSVVLQPQVGMNIFSISTTRRNLTNPDATGMDSVLVLGSSTGAFGFGKLNRVQDFTPRGLSLELKASFFEDAKKMLQTYVNKPELQQTIKDALAANQQGSASPACSEFATGASAATYPYVLHFNSENLYENIVVESLQPTSANGLQVQLLINNFNPDASIHIPGYPALIDPATGLDVNVTLLKFHIRTLRVSIGVHFNKIGDYNYLDIRALQGIRGADLRPLALDIVSSHGSGAIITIENPGSSTASRLRSILQPQFLDAFNKTLLCDLEKSLNLPVFFDPTNPPSGGFPADSFAAQIADLMTLNSTIPNNTFRIDFRQRFESLSKDLGLDIAYNVLKGNFRISTQSLRIDNVPVRISPAPSVHRLSPEILAGTVGAMSSPSTSTMPTSALTPGMQDFGLGISEDVINQALFAANATGLLNLTIDSNFYTDNNISFIAFALPTLNDMLGNFKLDLNQDGVIESSESNRPIQLRVATNTNFPPNLHFLNTSEKAELVRQVAGLNPDLNYVRLTLSNVELSYYAVDSSDSDLRNFCEASSVQVAADNENTRIERMFIDPANQEYANGHVCPGNISQVTTVDLNATQCQRPASTDETLYSTAQQSLGKIRIHNSREVRSALSGRENAPLVKLKANLILHAVIYPLKREITFASLLDSSNLSKIMTHLRFVPGNAASFKSFEVIENNTPLTDRQLRENRLNDLLRSAVTNSQCAPMNDFGIPIPDRFPDIGAAPSGLSRSLRDLGVSFIRLGGMQTNGSAVAVPQMNLDIDDSNLFLDLSSQLDVCYLSDRVCNPPFIFYTPIILDPSFYTRP